MPGFEDYIENVPDLPGEEIGGNFDCQDCIEEVDTAYYDKNNKRLAWRCINGHVSYIEEFRL